MEDLAQAILVSLLLVPAPLRAGTRGSSVPIALASEHRNAAESFRFYTPSSWIVDKIRESPEVLEARGDGVLMRFLHRGEEAGYDSLHADCAGGSRGVHVRLLTVGRVPRRISGDPRHG